MHNNTKKNPYTKLLISSMTSLAAFWFPTAYVLSADKSTSQFTSNLDSSKHMYSVNAVQFEIQCRLLCNLNVEPRTELRDIELAWEKRIDIFNVCYKVSFCCYGKNCGSHSQDFLAGACVPQVQITEPLSTLYF